MKVIHTYFRAGSVERGRDYTWRDGYSLVTPTGITYPWRTKREAQAEARKAGARAVFYETEAEARAAIAKAEGRQP